MPKFSSFFLGCVALVLTGCAPRGAAGPMPDFDIDARAGGVTALDGELKRESASLHQFMMGQLALNDQKLDEATDYFRRSIDLRGTSIPSVQADLAGLYLRRGQTKEALAEAGPAYEREPMNVERGLLYAGLLEAVGEQGRAREIYKHLMNVEGASFEPYILYGEALVQEGKLAEGRAVFERLVAKFPTDGSAHLYLGDACERVPDFKCAESAFRQVVILEPDNIAARLSIIRVLLRRGAFNEAQKLAEEYLARDAEVSPATILLREYVLKDKFAEGLEGLRAFTVLDESKVEVRYRLAFINMQRSNPEGAIRELSLLLAFDPSYGQARYHLGSLLAVQGRVQEGLREISKIPPSHEMYVKSRTFAAFVQRQQGDLAGAEKSIREALQEDRTNPQLVSYLVLVLRDAHKYSEARVLLEEAIERNPGNERLLFNHALVLNDLGREREAMIAMEQVIEVNPENADALNFIAYGLSVAGGKEQLGRARQLTERAMKLRPNDPYFLDTLGWILYQEGDLVTAREHLLRSHALVPDDPVIAEHCMTVLLKTGDIENAVRVGQTVLERAVDSKSREQRQALERVRKKLISLEQQAPQGPE